MALELQEADDGFDVQVGLGRIARSLSSSGSLQACTRAGAANKRKVFSCNADSDRIGWTLAGREEMEDQVDPFQQTSSPYIARGCHAHQHSAL